MNLRWTGNLPIVSGEADGEYLGPALTRAGRPGNPGKVGTKPMTDGRQAIPVLKLTTERAGTFALKTIPLRSWRAEFGGGDGIEPILWAAGVTRRLPPPLSCPTIDLAYHADRDEYWMLMDDVSPGILGMGVYDPVRLGWLFEGLAELHARYYRKTDELAGAPVLSLAQRADIACEPILALAGRRETKGWIGGALDNFQLMRPLVPVFLNFIRPTDADFYLGLLEQRADWTTPLASRPQTLVHGDVWHANFSVMAQDRIVLFDWDLASLAPPPLDLAWYWMLHFWCYPPADGKTVADREPLRQTYLRRLAQRIGPGLDMAGVDLCWDLGWLLAFSQLACLLTGALAGPHPPEARDQCAEAVDAAMSEARRILDARVR